MEMKHNHYKFDTKLLGHICRLYNHEKGNIDCQNSTH
jgi:hypothetical protein